MTKTLGRGLETLIPGWTTKSVHAKTEQIVFVPIQRVLPSPHQPRTTFHDDSIAELAGSIKDRGIIQPLVVIPRGEQFELIAGERRFRAAQKAGLSEVPVIVKQYNEEERFEVSLIENLQREDLNPMDEAEAYTYLLTHYGLTQEQLADKMKKKRSTIANTVRLLSLPDEIQQEIHNGVISAGQARALLSIPSNAERMKLVADIKKNSISVRQLEGIVRTKKHGVPTRERDPELRAVEEDLMKVFGARVRVHASGKGKKIKGAISVYFASLDDMNRLLEMLSK